MTIRTVDEYRKCRTECATSSAYHSIAAELLIDVGQDAIWRRQAARSFDDLGRDLTDGQWPQSRCAAEEVALHLMLRYASPSVGDDWWGLKDNFAALPEHKADFNWVLLSDVLFQDADILELFDPSRDGIENPEDEENQNLGMGDYTPAAWFTPFDNELARDPRRPFRR